MPRLTAPRTSRTAPELTRSKSTVACSSSRSCAGSISGSSRRRRRRRAQWRRTRHRVPRACPASQRRTRRGPQPSPRLATRRLSSCQNRRSRNTRSCGRLPAMIAALIAPIAVPAIQFGRTPECLERGVGPGLIRAERAAARQHQRDPVETGQALSDRARAKTFAPCAAPAGRETATTAPPLDFVPLTSAPIPASRRRGIAACRSRHHTKSRRTVQSRSVEAISNA